MSTRQSRPIPHPIEQELLQRQTRRRESIVQTEIRAALLQERPPHYPSRRQRTVAKIIRRVLGS